MIDRECTMNILTICIPTYNRASLIDEALNHLIPIISDLKIEICISDNASPDNTQAIIKKHQLKYPYINSYRQEKTREGMSILKVY
jgi:glycosyltransferase involved in cell wall biosynthesis